MLRLSIFLKFLVKCCKWICFSGIKIPHEGTEVNNDFEPLSHTDLHRESDYLLIILPKLNLHCYAVGSTSCLQKAKVTFKKSPPRYLSQHENMRAMEAAHCLAGLGLYFLNRKVTILSNETAV